MSDRNCKNYQISFSTRHPLKVFCGDRCKRLHWDKEHSRQRKIRLNTKSIILNSCRLCLKECRKRRQNKRTYTGYVKSFEKTFK